MRCGMLSLDSKVLLGVALQRGRVRFIFLGNNSAPLSHKAHVHGPGWPRAKSVDEKGLIAQP